ncbi:helix-turn-helix domain-containing protein [Rhodococcus globerulus]|uniref:helix-turn-helix domain-containing protein n=1 Tax=Rhodococcus globerulus TaxID=33008 RepID=UPI00301A7FCC
MGTRRCAPSGVTAAERRYLSILEWEFIADYTRDGWTLTAIANALGRAVSTTSRELQRHKYFCGRYHPYQADRDARVNARRPKPSKLEVNARLRGAVQGLLHRDFLPEQIPATLRKEFADDPEMHVSHKTIYRSFVRSG